MGNISVALPSDGETIDVADYNTPINTVVNEINGGLDNSNIAAAAAIAGSKLADASVTPVKRSGGFFIGTIAGATLGTTGNKVITGVGFIPKLVRFTVTPTASTAITLVGIGSMTTTSQYYLACTSQSTPTGSRNSSTSACIGWLTSGVSTPALLASYVSMDADGFTINVGTANGAFDIAYEAYA